MVAQMEKSELPLDTVIANVTRYITHTPNIAEEPLVTEFLEFLDNVKAAGRPHLGDLSKEGFKKFYHFFVGGQMAPLCGSYR